MFGGPPRTRQIVEDWPTLDVFKMTRAGFVRPGMTSIALAINGVEQTVKLVPRPAGTVGGGVTWLCPRCGATRRRLQIVAGVLGCRGKNCHLDYASHLLRGSRAIARVLRLRQRPRAGRAKLVAALRVAEAKALADLAGAMSRLEKHKALRDDGHDRRYRPGQCCHVAR
jgi:hypothetical protein